MDILNTVSLESNSQIKINFDGGDLSSDAELLLLKEFCCKIDKDALASQPTLSRFFNRMDETTLEQTSQILRELRKVVYSIKMPEYMLFDIDTTLLEAYGRQEGAAFNYHYQGNGYHPLFVYDEPTAI